MRIRNKNRAGMSLTEVVVALAVIVIVSITSISIVLSAMPAKVEATEKSYAQNFANNLWECFKASDSQEDFIDCVKFAEGIDLSLSPYTTLDDGAVIYTIAYGRGNCTAQVTVNFSSAGDTLDIQVRDQKGKEIVSFFYEKEVTS